MVRLVGDPNLNLARTSEKVIPLILVAHFVKIGDKFSTTKKDIVAQVVCGSVCTALGFISAQV